MWFFFFNWRILFRSYICQDPGRKTEPTLVLLKERIWFRKLVKWVLEIWKGKKKKCNTEDSYCRKQPQFLGLGNKEKRLGVLEPGNLEEWPGIAGTEEALPSWCWYLWGSSRETRSLQPLLTDAAPRLKGFAGLAPAGVGSQCATRKEQVHSPLL